LQKTQEPAMQEQSPGLSDSKSNPHLFKKAIRGGFWVFALRLLTQMLSMVKLVILYRLLEPEDFGLLGIATLSVGMMRSVTEMGFQKAIIQKKGNVEGYLNVIWTIGIVRGLLLFLIIFLISPFIAQFFSRPDAVSIIKVVSISVFLEPLVNIGVVSFVKELEFHKKFAHEIAGTIIGIISVIVLAFIYRNVWALVIGVLITSLTRCVTSYMLHPYRPRLNFDFAKARELWAFSRHFIKLAILKFICLHGDDIFLGRLLGATILGYYQQAFYIGTMVANEIGNKIAEVSFPAFAKIQDNFEKIRGGFFKTLQVSTLIVYPITGGLIILAYEFTGLVLGEKWLPMVPAMQILCVLGSFKCMQWSPVFMALGRPDILVRQATLRLIMISITIYPLTKGYGMAGTALCVLLPSSILQPIAFYRLKKLVGVKITDILGHIFFPLFATLIMMLAVFVTKKLLPEIALKELMLLVCIGAIVYSVIILAMSRFSNRYDAISLVREIAKGLK
jgi:lipopolysaccharide exporter